VCVSAKGMIASLALSSAPSSSQHKQPLVVVVVSPGSHGNYFIFKEIRIAMALPFPFPVTFRWAKVHHKCAPGLLTYH
jgi:hypothetical protein